MDRDVCPLVRQLPSGAVTHWSRLVIALDATPLSIGTGGVSRYTAELSRALARSFQDDQYWLVSDQPFQPPASAPPNLKIGPRPQSAADRRWWLWGLRRTIAALHADVFHGTDFAVPYTRTIPSVMTLHDLSPWLDRSWQPDAARVRRRTPRLLRYGFATMVITDSESVRRTAIERFRLAPERVVAIPLAASDLFRPVEAPKADTPFFLFVGTLEPRKNVGRLVEAWHEVRKHVPVELMLAGRTRADFDAPIAEPGLRILGPVPDEALPRLYSSALAVVYPSLYEGFGLPVLEAMQCGSLVITSRDPAISEIAGPSNALQVDAMNLRELVDAMLAVAQDPVRFANLRTGAAARAREFTWRTTAERTQEVYAEARRIFRQ